MRWLNMYQHEFHRNGFEYLKFSFRQTKDAKFQRNSSIGEPISVHDMIQTLNNAQCLIKFDEFSDINEKEISL